MNRAELRREFPNEPLPRITRANGSISKAALVTTFSACGCPQASADVAVALMKSGATESQAVQLAIFAAYVAGPHGPMIEPIERTARALLADAKVATARRHPWGKEAEDFAAAIEGRASRWGTADFHTSGRRETITPYYPWAVDGPVQS